MQSPSALVSVRLQPRASSDEVTDMRDGVLIARVTAPLVDGNANRALCKLIARRAGVAPSRVTIVKELGAVSCCPGRANLVPM